jgi:exonuclease VII large subunit
MKHLAVWVVTGLLILVPASHALCDNPAKDVAPQSKGIDMANKPLEVKQLLSFAKRQEQISQSQKKLDLDMKRHKLEHALKALKARFDRLKQEKMQVEASEKRLASMQSQLERQAKLLQLLKKKNHLEQQILVLEQQKMNLE